MKKLLLISFALVLLTTTKKVNAQCNSQVVLTSTSISSSPTYVWSGSANYGILFNIQNNNSYPIIVTDVSTYFLSTTFNNINILYNTTAVYDPNNSWVQDTVGIGRGGWTLAYSTGFAPTGSSVQSITNNTLYLKIPAYTTYGMAVYGDVVSAIGYLNTTGLGYGAGAFTANGVSIITGESVGWSLAQVPCIGNTYIRSLIGGITFKPYIPPTPPLASMVYDITIDTAWLNSPFMFVNTSNTYDAAYWDILSYSPTYNGTYTPYTPPSPRYCCSVTNTCYMDTLDVNFIWTFTKAGYYKVKVKVANLKGIDSVTKIVVCAPSTQKPVASFFSINKTVGFTDELRYYDLSSNGPTAWSWYLDPPYYGSNTYANAGIANAFYDQFGHLADTSIQNPYLFAVDGGVFDVCLAVGNSVGWDTLCRHNYLTVNNGYMMCNGQDSVSTLSAGYIYDQGGPNGNYQGVLTGNCSAGFRINACADSVFVDIDRFKLYTGDSVFIRIGSPIGPLVSTLKGSSLPDSLKHYRIPGADVFIQMFSSLSSPGDSGFSIHWTTAPPTFSKPKASFTFTTNGPTVNGIPSVYKGYPVHYSNTTTGENLIYSWDTNGDGIFGTSIGGDSSDANPSWLANTVGLFNVCLKVYNCVGYDSVCRQIRVLPLAGKPIADMTVNKTYGFSTDIFTFYDNSANGPITWQWSFSPSTVVFLNGTSATSQNPIVFLNTVTCYTVTLKASNALGSSTKVIPCMVNVIGYNSPGSAYSIPTGSDIGISRVTLGKIDTTTALQTPTYTQMNNTQIATLYRGLSYTVTTYRLTNNDPMTTGVWIDFNLNADFTDSGETIISEQSQYKISTSKTFKVSDINPIGTSRMRVGITYDSTDLTPNIAQVGCFEDYGINIGIDYVKPVLSLKGPAIYKMQVGKTYTEWGVTATDNLEGDISSRYVRTGFLDVNTVGYYTLTYTIADLYGNISLPVTRIVQVELDQTGPTIVLNGSDSVIVGVKYNYTELGATAMDNLGRNITNLIATTSNVNTMVLGTDAVIYSITDAYGFTATIKRTVMVVDTTKPEIRSINGKNGTDSIRFQIGTPFNYQNFVSATDNYWTNLQLIETGSINVNVQGYYTLLFNATDGSGNQANPFRLVVKIDNTILPVITLNDASDLTVDVNTNFVDPGINYSSAYYLSSLLVVTTTSNLDMTKLGTYTITYCVNDPSDNMVCITRTVHVVDRIAPVITLIGKNPYNLPRYQKYIDPGHSVSDNFYTEAVLNNFLTVDESKVKNDVPGMYYVYFNVTDPSGNKSKTVKRTVFVQDMFGGINSLNISGKMKIYPNPNNGKFTIELENETSVQSIKVYSIIGSLIKDISINTNSKNIDVDMSDVNEGIYIVKLDGQSGSFTQKINIIK